MHYYPPEWFKKTTVDPLTAWEEYGDSLVFWVQDAWDAFFEDELRSIWKLTFYTGTAALILLIILFLEGLRPTARPAIAKKKADSVPTFEHKIQPPVKPLDPFNKYQWDDTPTVPTLTDFPKPEPTFELPEKKYVPPPVLPELVLNAEKTGLFPDFRHSEKSTSVVAKSKFISPQGNHPLLASGWKKPSFDKSHNPFALSVPTKKTKKNVSWFDTPVAITTASSPQFKNETTPLQLIHSEFSPETKQEIAGIVLTKKLPKNIIADTAITYELVVKNKSTVIQNNVVIEELISHHQCVVNVAPVAKVSEKSLQWVIDSLKPEEERRFKVTCITSRDIAALKTESQMQLSYAVSSETNVFIPEVVISLTLPIEVKKSARFPVQIEISNHSDRTFANSELKIHLVKGVLMKNSKELTRQIEIPAPGKSISLPITLTATEVGSGVIEAELDLADSLMVPVKAHTKIHAEENSEQKKNEEVIAKKTLSGLVSSGKP